MIYYYFNNKKELFDDIQNDYFDLLLRHCQQLQTDDITVLHAVCLQVEHLSDYDKKNLSPGCQSLFVL